MILAADRRQARVIYRYIHALLTRTPMLAELIERETAEAIDLTNGTTIEIAAASYRSVRGYTLIAALCDEIAFGAARGPPIRTARSLPHCARRWRPSPMRCCSARRHRTRAEARCGTRTAGTTVNGATVLDINCADRDTVRRLFDDCRGRRSHGPP
jgi:hypothetical protein